MRKLELVRVKIKKIIDGAVKLFEADGYARQKIAGEFLQQFGLTSRPAEGSEGIVIQLANGSFLICTGDTQRFIEINDGEVCLHASPAVKIHLKADDSIEIAGSAISYKITGDMIAEISGNMQSKVAGDMVSDVAGTAQIKSANVELGTGTLDYMLIASLVMVWANAHVHTVAGVTSSPPVTPMTPAVQSKTVKNS